MRFKAFPVSVVVEGEVREPALIWATDEATDIYVSGPNREVIRIATFAGATAKVRAHGEFLEGEPRRRVMFVVELADGSRLLAGKSPGCGCGNPLKSWSPPMVETPT